MPVRLPLLAALLAVTSAAPVAAQDSAQGPTDPQIAAIVVAANTVDIDAGKLAAGRSDNAEVKAFAQQMIKDHSAVNASATKLVTKLHVTPEANATSRQLTDGGAANLKALKDKKGAEFDKAYIDHEVAYHQSVLDAVDQTLIPSAKNAELKALLEQTRPAFVAHLAHAKHVQESLAKQ
jgi:putative membrane protein